MIQIANKREAMYALVEPAASLTFARKFAVMVTERPISSNAMMATSKTEMAAVPLVKSKQDLPALVELLRLEMFALISVVMGKSILVQT